ncbi:transporter [Bacillus coahuilensis p1.1.43]|uniref:Transporter n=1 Tax=Bacillus coahuilensis p1.1.43 TaxID=1150625 RepID=A0A147KAK5_9BACI|nr:MATE family efflux transporter [Bacillus coahuilensis]KUP07759.1 transporter [Bacillus coahuilensis p1.1.43]
MSNTAKKLTLFSLTWPIFIEVFLHMLMGNADTLMLSQYSDDSVAAVGVSNSILYLIIVMFGFITTGTSILISQNLGANKDRTAKEIAVTSLAANLAIGLMLSIGLFALSSHLLSLMNLQSELMEEASKYLKIVGGFAFIQALIMTNGAILRSYGFTKDAMYITIGMNILNIIGNYFFIFGPFGLPVLGVEGVAISTAGSRLIGLIVSFIVLLKRLDYTLPFSILKTVPKDHLKNLLQIGIPSAGEQLSYSASQFVITIFVNSLGTEALTTKVYTQNITLFIFMFSIALSQGTQILIGHQIGAGKYEDAYRRGIKSLKIAIFTTIVIAASFVLFSSDLFSLFTNNEKIIALGGTLLLINAFLEPGRSTNLVIINSLRAAGDVRFPVYVGIASMWGVSVLLSYLLGIVLGLGLIGIWISFLLDEWIRGILMVIRWRNKKWAEKSFVHGSSL